MRFRKLRIAWSVFWGSAAVLLIVLWVRSYSWSNIFISSRWNPIAIMSHGQVFYDVNYSWSSCIKQERIIQHRGHWYNVQNIWNPDGRGVEIYGYKKRVPIWPLAVYAVTATTFPWLLWFRYRFSLRTLLIATALVALVLGLIAYLSN